MPFQFMEKTDKEKKLSNYIIDIAAGPFGSNLKVDCFVPEGFPIIDGANLKGIKVTDNVTKFVTEEKARSLHRSIAKRNDVVVTISGNVGQISYIPSDSKYDEYLVSQRQFRVTFDTTKVYVPYLIYYFHTKEGQHKILSFANQTGVPALAQPLKNFKNINILLPDLQVQKSIVSILEKLDDKIELNQRINENLEQQAQALFKSWFVDFEPFKNGKFIDSELGRIPEELIIRNIGNIPHTIESGRRPKGGAVSKGIPSIGAENIKGLGIYDYSKTKYIPEDFAATTNRGEIKGYELLIYKDGGKPGYFIPNYTIFGDGFPFDVMFINEHVFRLDLMSNEYNIFAYFYMQTPYIMNQLNSIGGKAAIPGINTKDLESLPIFTDDNKKVQEFGRIALPMITTILRNCRENARLAQLRDTLLPKLMSGKIDISNLNIE